LKDILFLRGDKFAFKTADFLKRNKKSLAHTLEHIWDELKKVGRGLRIFKEDIKFYFKFQKGKYDTKYDTQSYKQEAKLKQVR
jgi:hypothetical protein